MSIADILVIGGGIAGLSAAAGLAAHRQVVLLEAEDALGFHSSGRSATFAHYGIGDATVRAPTSYSRRFFLDPPPGFTEAPIARAAGALFVADEEMRPTLAALEADMARFSPALRRVAGAELLGLCPILDQDVAIEGVLDKDGLKLEADALLQGYARRLRVGGGEIRTGAPVQVIRRVDGDWEVGTPAGTFTAPVLVNAAGAWADRIADLAGVAPLGLTARRRTIIVVDPPAGLDIADWPFVKSAADAFYMLPEAGRLMASPVDEVQDEPGDAQPDDYDIALAAHRLEQWTTLRVSRIAHRWAGLRTFTADRVPVAGFAPDAPGFFWLAGQGGYGLQTAPAMAAAVESLVAGTAWPEGLVSAATLSPMRLMNSGSPHA
jgi:D-arginine dehydrogenase